MKKEMVKYAIVRVESDYSDIGFAENEMSFIPDHIFTELPMEEFNVVQEYIYLFNHESRKSKYRYQIIFPVTGGNSSEIEEQFTSDIEKMKEYIRKTDEREAKRLSAEKAKKLKAKKLKQEREAKKVADFIKKHGIPPEAKGV